MASETRVGGEIEQGPGREPAAGIAMKMTAAAARIAELMMASVAARPNRPMPLLTIITSSFGRPSSASATMTVAKAPAGMAPAKNSAKAAHDGRARNGSDSNDRSRKPAVKTPIRRGRTVAIR